MSMHTISNTNERDRLRLAAEVLELGEGLFEAALEAKNQQSKEGEEGDIVPAEEIRAASDEFFTALRLLLRIED